MRLAIFQGVFDLVAVAPHLGGLLLHGARPFRVEAAGVHVQAQRLQLGHGRALRIFIQARIAGHR